MGLGLQDLEKDDDFEETENFNYRKEGVLDAVSRTTISSLANPYKDHPDSMMPYYPYSSLLQTCQNIQFGAIFWTKLKLVITGLEIWTESSHS